jgi:hypothetical protein
MKPIMPEPRKRTVAVSRILTGLTAALLLPTLRPQEAPAPAESENSRPAGVPGGTTPPIRSRTVRVPPGEGFSQPFPERAGSRSSAPGLRPPSEVAPARFEASVYEVRVPEARLAELEAPALEARAATTQDLAKALGEFGEARLLYKLDQTVNLYGENIVIGSREPMVTGSRRMDSGPAINTISYQEVGLIVTLAANPPAPDAPRKQPAVQVNFELSTMSDGGVEIAPSVKASRFRNLQLSHSETPRFGRPMVLLHVAATPGDEKAPPTAYVVRYVFREVKP